MHTGRLRKKHAAVMDSKIDANTDTCNNACMSMNKAKPTLTEVSRSVRYAEIATRLGTTEGAVKVAVHRLRQRYREVLRMEIADTVASPGEVEDEIRNLFAALAG